MNAPSFAQFRRALYALVLAIGLPVTAAAQEAVPALQQAVQAVERAEQADADQYAPELIETARGTLIQAQSAALADRRRDRAQAQALALRAAADADLARARSEEAKAEARLQQSRREIADLRRKLGIDGEDTL